ncbi:MAG: hypothetical protein WCS99_14895 [Limisphaerales bacterium]
MNRTKQTKRPMPRLTPAGRALRRAGQAARTTARAHGTPIYVWQDGKVVALKP